MHELGPAITQALHLLLSGDTVLWSIIGVSFSVSLRAIAIATPLACGNTVVMKSSELCPRVHALIVEAVSEAGLPPAGATDLGRQRAA